jgi:hypothetical protein
MTAAECPECGREAIRVSHFEDYSTYAHEIDESGVFPVITDSCYVDKSGDHP